MKPIEEFAIGLQREIEKEEGIKFRVVENQVLKYHNKKWKWWDCIFRCKEVKNYMILYSQKEYIDSKGKVQDSLKNELRDGTFENIP